MGRGGRPVPGQLIREINKVYLPKVVVVVIKDEEPRGKPSSHVLSIFASAGEHILSCFYHHVRLQ